MPGWWESLFGSSPPPPPARPPSRGALLGAGYQAMPNMTASIEDRRQDYPYAGLMRDTRTDPMGQYPRSSMGGEQAGSNLPVGYGMDPMPVTSVSPYTAEDIGSYQPSFQPNLKPPTRGTPYLDPRMGPQLPQYESRIGVEAGPGSYTDSDLYSGSYLPPIGAHLPISPGEPGWTPPPSPSGPHNLRGDPPRPGYDRPSFNLDAASQYELEPVDHDPFAPPQEGRFTGGRVGYDDGGGVADLGQGALNYQALPTSPNIEDRRGAPIDLAAQMKSYGRRGRYFRGDPMLKASNVADPRNNWPGAYSYSFPQNFQPDPVSQRPLQRPSEPSLNLPPYVGPRVVMDPSDPGWNPHGDAPMWTESPFPPEEGFARGGGLSLINRPFYRAGLSG